MKNLQPCNIAKQPAMINFRLESLKSGLIDIPRFLKPKGISLEITLPQNSKPTDRLTLTFWKDS